MFDLPKKARLLKRAQFQALSKQGTKVYANDFLALVRAGTTHNNRIGVTVSKKVGNAVERNRIKRIIREYFRRNRKKISGPVDINIIAGKGLASFGNRQIYEKLDKLFKKIKTGGF